MPLALVFIGSLIYMYLTFLLLGPEPGNVSNWQAGVGGVWQPVFASAAVLCSIALFISTIASMFFGYTDSRASAIKRSTWIGGFSIFVITAGVGALQWAIAGLVIAVLGELWIELP